VITHLDKTNFLNNELQTPNKIKMKYIYIHIKQQFMGMLHLTTEYTDIQQKLYIQTYLILF
jgi:hypothetical protein